MGELFCPNCLSASAAEHPRCVKCDFSRPPAGWPAHEYLGQTFGEKYKVERKLGEGGFGVVLLARQIKGEHDLGYVVLKFLHPHLASQPSLRKRFINEARAARALTSQHVVKVFDFDFDEKGNPYLVMEYLEGQQLHPLIKQGAMEPGRVTQIGIQITGALQECHAAGILHRDLTPKNILLLPGRYADFVKVIDFGIAYLPGGTLSETMLGTPKYMAPEQIRQGPTDERVDIFALGVLLFEAFSGKTPMLVARSVDYLQANLERAPRPLRSVAPGLPAELETLINSMIAKARDDRPRTMAEVEARLIAIGNSVGWIATVPYNARGYETLSLGGGSRVPEGEPEMTAATVKEKPGRVNSSSGIVAGPRKSRGAWLLLLSLLVGLGLITMFWWSGSSRTSGTTSPPRSTTIDVVSRDASSAKDSAGLDAASAGAQQRGASTMIKPLNARSPNPAGPKITRPRRRPKTPQRGYRRSRKRGSPASKDKKGHPASKRKPVVRDNDFVKVPGGL